MTDIAALIADLRAKAEKATPGPWSQHDNHPMYGPSYSHYVWGSRGPGHGAIVAAQEPNPTAQATTGTENAAFIAAANPSAILSLISAMEEARRERDDERKLRGELADDARKLFDIALERDALRAQNDKLKAVLDCFKFAEQSDWNYLVGMLGFHQRGPEDSQTGFWIETIKAFVAAHEAIKEADHG